MDGRSGGEDHSRWRRVLDPDTHANSALRSTCYEIRRRDAALMINRGVRRAFLQSGAPPVLGEMNEKGQKARCRSSRGIVQHLAASRRFDSAFRGAFTKPEAPLGESRGDSSRDRRSRSVRQVSTLPPSSPGRVHALAATKGSAGRLNPAEAASCSSRAHQRRGRPGDLAARCK